MENSTFQKKVFPMPSSLIPLALSLIALTFITCCKDKPDEPSDPVLPALTNEGKNTFGCYIDGVPFVAGVKFTIGGSVAVSGLFNENTNLLKIQANREDSSGKLEKVNFQVYVVSLSSNIEMNVLIEDYDGYTDYSGEKCEYYHDINNKGVVNITFLDIDKNIISGTFGMTLINPNCSTKKAIVITDGRFDFGY